MDSNETLNALVARQQTERFAPDLMAALDCAIFFREQMENYRRSVERAHAVMDESKLIGPRSRTHQGLTPRIKSIVRLSNSKDEPRGANPETFMTTENPIQPQTQSEPQAPALRSGDLFGSLRVRWQNLLCWRTRWAYRTLTRAMKRDPDFAHTWQCNIACPLMDAGMNHRDANAAADRLMRHLFGVVNYTEPNIEDDRRRSP